MQAGANWMDEWRITNVYAYNKGTLGVMGAWSGVFYAKVVSPLLSRVVVDQT